MDKGLARFGLSPEAVLAAYLGQTGSAQPKPIGTHEGPPGSLSQLGLIPGPLPLRSLWQKEKVMNTISLGDICNLTPTQGQGQLQS